jgi:predicted nuclease of predicted toxin-antitoxin system
MQPWEGSDREKSVACPDVSLRVGFLRILLDEMFAGLKEYLEVLGWDNLTVQEIGLQGARDKEIIDYAKKENLLLVTQDQKSAELADLMAVRNVYVSKAAVSRIIDDEIRKKYPKAMLE